MQYDINYSHIFFDKYNLSYEEKRREAEYLVEKLLQEGAEDIKGILKREFFIILTEKEKSEEELLCEEIAVFLKENCTRDILTVEDVCDKFSLKRSRADALFIKQYGISLKEYILNLRLEKAKNFLQRNTKIEDCANCCGFGSVKTMQRAFKTKTGLTPAEWRCANLDSKIEK